MTESPPEGGGLGYLLMASSHAWRASLGRRLAVHGLTAPQFFAVMAVHRRATTGGAPMTQRQVAQQTGMDENVVSQVSRTLERRGLLQRVAHPRDSRALTVELTPSGRDLAEVTSEIARALNDEFFRGANHSVLQAELAQLTEPI